MKRALAALGVIGLAVAGVIGCAVVAVAARDWPRDESFL